MRSSVRSLIAACVVLLVACSPSADPASEVPDSAPNADATSSPNYVGFDDAADEPQVVAPAAAEPALVVDADGVLVFFERFSAVRDDVIVGRSPDVPLASMATPRVASAIEDQAKVNLALLDNGDPSGRDFFASFPRVLDMEEQNGRVFFTDCTERHGRAANGDIEVLFVDQAVVLDVSGSDWFVESIEVRHDGSADAVGYGCVPPSFVERSIEAAERGLLLTDQLLAEPELIGSTAVDTVFAGQALVILEESYGAFASSGRRRVTTAQYRLEPVGMRTDQFVRHVVAIRVCRHYPDGVADEVLASGELESPNPELSSPGSSEEELVFVWLPVDGARDGSSDRVVGFEPTDTVDCWEDA